MKHILKDLERNTTREIDTSILTLKQWIKINFGYWGLYNITKIKNEYTITDKLNGNVVYIVK